MAIRHPGPTPPFNREELAWAAGFLDGEGCFRQSVSRKTYSSLRICATQVRKEPLDRLQRILGGRVNGPYHSRSIRRKNGQPQYQWVIGSNEHFKSVAMILWEFLSEPKKEQILCVIDKHNKISKRLIKIR